MNATKSVPAIGLADHLAKHHATRLATGSVPVAELARLHRDLHPRDGGHVTHTREDDLGVPAFRRFRR